jgi:hypothetical protein
MCSDKTVTYTNAAADAKLSAIASPKDPLDWQREGLDCAEDGI